MPGPITKRGALLAGLLIGTAATAPAAHAGFSLGGAPTYPPCSYCGTVPEQTAQDATFAVKKISANVSQAIAASTQTLGAQLQADTIAEGKLLTQQDQQRAETAKQLQAARYRNKAENKYQAPNAGLCSQSIGQSMVGAGGLMGSADNIPSTVNKITTGGAPPGGAPVSDCKISNCYGTNMGRRFTTAREARRAILKEPSKTFAATDSFLPSVQNSGAKGMQQMNRYIAAVVDPEPPANVPAADTNTAPGQKFEAKAREREASLSLAQSILLHIGLTNLPTKRTSVLTSAQSAAGTKLSGTGGSTFAKLLKSWAKKNGTPGKVSDNQVLKAYSTAFALNPNFYQKVPDIAANASSYRKYMLMFAAMRMYLEYQNERLLQSIAAVDAGSYAHQTTHKYNRLLKALRQKAVSDRTSGGH